MKAVLLVGLLVWSSGALAHKASDSYLALDLQPGGASGQWDIALRDLDDAIGLDADDDGAITWGELRTREQAVAAYALTRLVLTADRKPCPARLDDLQVDEHTDGKYAVLRFSAVCPGDAHRFGIGYRLLFDLDAQHRGLLRLTDGGRVTTTVFSPDVGRLDVDRGSPIGPWREFLAYARTGIGHIWIGYDHILFLLSLLLPAVLIRETGRWMPARDVGAVAWDVVGIVTAFTVAHSLTLSLAAMGHVWLPSRWVESGIAASVIIAALNNLVPLWQRRRVLLAFLFGLVHGLGFASVLQELRLPGSSRLIALLGFNVGVEAGQLLLVAAFLPPAYRLGKFAFYPRAVLQGGSGAIALIAGVWLTERIVDRPLPAWFG